MNLDFKKTTLKNGVRVVSEHHSHSRAVSIGVWVRTGTRHEPSGRTGLTHFLEHLVFKGTKTKSALQIAKSLEVYGGDLNAYTTREYTCYHALVLKEHWEKALEVLADLVSNWKSSRNDFELERSVILQEIAMGEDNLEELVFDIQLERSLGEHPLGRSIIGTVESVSATSMKDVKDYYRKHYNATQIIVSCAGALTHEELVSGVQRHLGRKSGARVRTNHKAPRWRPTVHVEDRPVEQLHLLLGFPCPSFKSPKRYDAFVVNSFLGGGMTSKLYQSVREKKGLAYSVYSSLNTFEDFGMLNIYAACEPRQMKDVLHSIIHEIERLRKMKVSETAVKQFKTQVKGNLLLGAEDVENRMSSLGVNEMVFGTYRSVDHVIDELDRVSVNSVNEFIDSYLDAKTVSCVLLGGSAQSLTKWVTETIHQWRT